jgi:hypothetical protein
MEFAISETLNLDFFESDSLSVVIDDGTNEVELPITFRNKNEQYYGSFDMEGNLVDFFLNIENEANGIYIKANLLVDLYICNVVDDGYRIHICNRLNDEENEEDNDYDESFSEKCTITITQQNIITKTNSTGYQNIIMSILQEYPMDIMDIIDMKDLMKYAVSYTKTERAAFEQEIQAEIEGLRRQHYMQNRGLY